MKPRSFVLRAGVNILRSLQARSWLLALFFSITGPACSHLRTTPIPLRSLRRSVQPEGEGRATTLIVMLPGRGDRLGDFERHGFISTLRDANIRADVVMVDAHLGYYYKRTIIERLQADVFAPARAQGYRRIVVAGISLGGLGALLSARDQPASVDGLILLSPYVGNHVGLFQEIGAAGGPALWAAKERPTKGNVDREIWTFLGRRASTLPPTWLFFGADDYLKVGQRLLADLLPPHQVTVIPGAHDWATWQKLWQKVCQSSDIFAEEKSSSSSSVPTQRR